MSSISINSNQSSSDQRWSSDRKVQLRAILPDENTTLTDATIQEVYQSPLKNLIDISCVIRVSQHAQILFCSHKEWLGYPIAEWKQAGLMLTQLMAADEIQMNRISDRWRDWLQTGGRPIRIWFKDPEDLLHRTPLEIRVLSFYPKGHVDGNEIILHVKDLSAEWSFRQKWRQKFSTYRKQRKEAELDFASWLHDWKTPLGTIESSIWLCLRYNGQDDQEKRRIHLKKMERAVHEMKIGMQDWQTWHQPPTLRSLQRVPIVSLIRERIDQLKPLLRPGQNIHLWNQGKREIYTDPQAFTHVLDNILSNASKYSPEHTSIWVRVWNQKDRLQIDIRDEGIGIPTQEIDRLFEPRYRASNAIDIPGNGLGLSTVDRLVKQLGGTIQVISQPNCGTTISITLKNQQKSYEKDLNHRGQSRNPFQHRRDIGASTVPHTNR